MAARAAAITWVGHSTALIELDGARLITDPALRNRLLHLRRIVPAPPREVTKEVDAALISHLHHDHLDLPSIRRLPASTRIIGPSGLGRHLDSRRSSGAEELHAGDRVEIGDLGVRAVLAAHDNRRPPFGRDDGALGYVIEGSRSIYFAGDTGLFDGMSEIGPVDVALLPVWGWGPRAGPGHLNPERAVQALKLIRPRLCIPIHWGTLVPLHLLLRRPRRLTDAGATFARLAADAAPDVTVRDLKPMQRLELY